MGMKSNSNQFKGTNGAKKHEEMVKHKPLLKLNIQLFAKLPEKRSQLMHLFRDESGHLLDTPENREIIVNLTDDKSNYLGPGKHGLYWYAKDVEGGQLWATTMMTSRGEEIQNCGFNDKNSTVEYKYGVGMIKSEGKVIKR